MVSLVRVTTFETYPTDDIFTTGFSISDCSLKSPFMSHTVPCTPEESPVSTRTFANSTGSLLAFVTCPLYTCCPYASMFKRTTNKIIKKLFIFIK